jgi:hypothetical protein
VRGPFRQDWALIVLIVRLIGSTYRKRIVIEYARIEISGLLSCDADGDCGVG